MSDRYQYIVATPRPPKSYEASDFLVRERPWFGRLERTRYSGLCRSIRRLIGGAALRRNIHDLLNLERPAAIHATAHGDRFWPAFEWATENATPFFLSVHDDIRHLLKGSRYLPKAEERIAEAWRSAMECFVISPELGSEYCERYGPRSWIQVTDGSDEVREPADPVVGRLHVYFAGLLHVQYESNFRALYKSLSSYKALNPDVDVKLVLRGGRYLDGVVDREGIIDVRPFTSHSLMLDEMSEMDILYLPLSFDDSDQFFTKFSLSTKMVSYLASGCPILYHGPPDSAAVNLLRSGEAASACFSNAESDIQAALRITQDQREALVRGAHQLACSKFYASEVRSRFWSGIYGAIGDS